MKLTFLFVFCNLNDKDAYQTVQAKKRLPHTSPDLVWYLFSFEEKGVAMKRSRNTGACSDIPFVF